MFLQKVISAISLKNINMVVSMIWTSSITLHGLVDIIKLLLALLKRCKSVQLPFYSREHCLITDKLLPALRAIFYIFIGVALNDALISMFIIIIIIIIYFK